MQVQQSSQLYLLLVQMGKSCYVQAHHLNQKQPPVLPLYEYQGQHLKLCVNLQVQKAINDVSFLQTRPLLLILLQGAFQSTKNAQSLGEFYLTKTALRFALRNLDVLVVAHFQARIQFQYVQVVHDHHHQL